MTRGEAQEQIVRMLMEKIRQDHYPSATQMGIVEQSLPQHLVEDYLAILLEKVAQDTIPSIPMLRRISRVVAKLPVHED